VRCYVCERVIRPGDRVTFVMPIGFALCQRCKIEVEASAPGLWVEIDLDEVG
jgi:hypothetical protein